VFVDGANGLVLYGGNMRVSLERIKIDKCTEEGLHLGPDVEGTVSLTRCEMRSDVANLTGAKCRYVVDGQHVRSRQFRPMTHQATPQQLQSFRNILPLKTCRDMKGSLGLNNLLHCGHCSVLEEDGQKFKLCAQCKEVCYCSRECQKAHWQEHKKVCGVRATL